MHGLIKLHMITNKAVTYAPPSLSSLQLEFIPPFRSSRIGIELALESCQAQLVE